MPQPEPRITINGHELTEAQAMTLRVALSTFRLQLNDPDYLHDLGTIGLSYRQHAQFVERMMVAT